MKRIVVLFAVLGSCIPLPNHPTPLEVSRSTYKIVVDEDVDVSEMTGVENDHRHTGGSGTAWVSGRSLGKSSLMTAGHTCETGKFIEYAKLDIVDGELKIVVLKLPIIGVTYDLQASDGTSFKGATVVLDDDELDLCMLTIAGDLGDPLPIADHDPPYGSHSIDVGAPTGLWGGGVAPIIDLVFSGRGQIFGQPPDALAFTGLGAPGSSGSAIVYQGRVVGVLTLGSVRYTRLMTSVPWNVIRPFIRRAMHKIALED